MMEPLLDQDPGDECDRHLESGLCTNEWCQDAALPDEDFCAGCLEDLQVLIAEFAQESA